MDDTVPVICAHMRKENWSRARYLEPGETRAEKMSSGLPDPLLTLARALLARNSLPTGRPLSAVCFHLSLPCTEYMSYCCFAVVPRGVAARGRRIGIA